MIIHVRQGNGREDCYLIQFDRFRTSPRPLEKRPTRNTGRSSASIRSVLRTTRQLQGVRRHVAEAATRDKTATVHRPPNCFTIQLLNRGVDSRAIQALLEHRHINVTRLYARVAINRQIQSSIELPTMQWLAA